MMRDACSGTNAERHVDAAGRWCAAPCHRVIFATSSAAECYRVLRPGGVLSISDISAQRWPVTPAELLAGLTQLRVFGLRRTMAVTAGQIAAEARAAGLAEVQVRRCGERVIAPALRLTAQRLKNTTAAPAGQHAAARLLLGQVNLLWQRQIIDYLLLRAIRP